MVLTVEEGPPSAGAGLEGRASEIRGLKRPPSLAQSLWVGVAAEVFHRPTDAKRMRVRFWTAKR